MLRRKVFTDLEIVEIKRVAERAYLTDTACEFDQQVPESLGVNNDATFTGNNTSEVLPSMFPPTLPVLSDEQLLLKKRIVDLVLVLTNKPTRHLPAL